MTLYVLPSSPSFYSLCPLLLYNRWVNTDLLQKEFADGEGISRSTAHHWIARLGFRWSRHGKCVYVDGHNRPDVLEARKEYTAQMFILPRTMAM